MPTLSGGRRRRPGAGRWGLAGGLVAAGAILAVLAAGTGSRPGRAPAPARHRAAVSVVGQPPAARRRSPAPSGQAATDREIGRVLRLTPVVTAGVRRGRAVALTFDDGPSPYTAPIIRTLVRMHVPATFFVVGQQLRYFGAGVQAELRHGFTVGDHTVNHAFLPRLGASGQRHQIARDAQLLRAAGAPPVRLFRPPYGAYDRATLSALARLRMLMVLWSIDPGDWRRPGARAIVAAVLRSARPGAIVILHDGGGDRSQTLAALPAIIRGLRRHRLRLVSLPALLTLDPPPRRQRLPRLIGA